MNERLLVEAELTRHPWSSLRTIDGFAGEIPGTLRSLFSARSPSELQEAYWRLENHVVVQGQLFEASVAVTQVLMAALANEDTPAHVRIGILELVFQLTAGESHEAERSRGLEDLGLRCRTAAREGIWLLYRELVNRQSPGAREVLEILDPNRLAAVERALAHS